LIDKYRNDAETYPDACKQSREDELNWIENQLKNSDAKWKIVMGHHPVFAQTDKSIDERDQMQKYLKPLLDRYNVDVYVCGHIHNFQHIQPKDSKNGVHSELLCIVSAQSKANRRHGVLQL
jgi:3',5'-cyclic AMP phosphodiesterase CpdA